MCNFLAATLDKGVIIRHTLCRSPKNSVKIRTFSYKSTIFLQYVDQNVLIKCRSRFDHMSITCRSRAIGTSYPRDFN